MTFPTVRIISCQQLFDLSRHKSVELIDVRSLEEFAEVRASLARNVPIDALDPQALLSGRSASADEPLYFICKMGGRSEMACHLLRAAGFTNVVNVEGGTDAWVAAGLPVIEPPASTDR